MKYFHSSTRKNVLGPLLLDRTSCSKSNVTVKIRGIFSTVFFFFSGLGLAILILTVTLTGLQLAEDKLQNR